MSLWDSFRLRKISSTPSGSLEKSQASHPAPQNLDSSKTEMIARRKSIDFCCHKLSNFKVLHFAWSCYGVRTSNSLLWRAKRSAQTILVTKTLAFLPVPVSRSDPRLERKSIAKVIKLLHSACAQTLICCDVAFSTQSLRCQSRTTL